MRESLSESGMILETRLDAKQIVLRDTEGNRELWFKNQNTASYAIVIDGVHYEFARSM